jgi:hypothetical protein
MMRLLGIAAGLLLGLLGLFMSVCGGFAWFWNHSIWSLATLFIVVGIGLLYAGLRLAARSGRSPPEGTPPQER